MKYFIFLLLTLSTGWMACQSSSETKNSDGVIVEVVDYQVLGQEISAAAFAALSSNLMKAMEEGGVSGAVDYCHVQAYPITDEVGASYKAQIRRVSNRYRNPENAPTDFEAGLLAYYEGIEDPGQAKDTLIQLPDASMVYAKPILLQGPCVKCHGTLGETLAETDYEFIRSKYPQDKAIGFAPGDFRGLWVIRFN